MNQSKRMEGTISIKEDDYHHISMEGSSEEAFGDSALLKDFPSFQGFFSQQLLEEPLMFDDGCCATKTTITQKIEMA